VALSGASLLFICMQKKSAIHKIAQEKADSILKPLQMPEVTAHQPDTIEVFYPEITQEIDGVKWTLAESKDILKIPLVVRVEYDDSGSLYIVKQDGKNGCGKMIYKKYWFANLTYEEWNNAVNQLEWKKP